MRFTEEEMKTLSAYEPNMRTAITANYARYPGTRAMNEILRIYKRSFAPRGNLCKTCASTICAILVKLGNAYFAQKDAETIDIASKINDAEEDAPVEHKRAKSRKNTKNDDYGI